MRLQYLPGVAALILVLGVAIWVSFRYIPH
jgi:hypothetical protein